MKVRIVKCGNPNEWYVDKLGDILTVRDATFHFYAYEGKLRILKEDCEIMEADATKPEPFDLERALKGDKVITRSGKEVTQIHMFDAPKTMYPLLGVIDGDIICFRKDGDYTDDLHNNDLFMASPEPEYQTVWVNLYKNYNIHASLFRSSVFESEDEALKKANVESYISTFPITFKKP